MMMRGVRTFATMASHVAEVAARAEASNAYGVRVSKAQGYVNGFIGGKRHLSHLVTVEGLSIRSNW